MLLESLRYFLNLLEVEAFWPILVIVLAFIGAPICGYCLKGKTEITKDKDGNVVMKHYQSRE